MDNTKKAFTSIAILLALVFSLTSCSLSDGITEKDDIISLLAKLRKSVVFNLYIFLMIILILLAAEQVLVQALIITVSSIRLMMIYAHGIAELALQMDYTSAGKDTSTCNQTVTMNIM